VNQDRTPADDQGLASRRTDPNATINILGSKGESKQVCSFLLVSVHIRETTRAFLGEKVSELENAGNGQKKPPSRRSFGEEHWIGGKRL